MILLFLALGCGLIASIGISQVIKRQNEAGEGTGTDMQPIFVAMREISLGDKLVIGGEEANIKIEEWPATKVPDGALTELSEVEGREARAFILSGLPVLEPMLLGENEIRGGASNKVPKGYRVVSVKGNVNTAGGNLMLPGDRVDVMLFAQADARRGIPTTGMRTILEDIKIFAVNQQTDRPGSNEEGEKGMTAVKTVSLLVTPKQAKIVALAEEVGSLRLVMRSPQASDEEDDSEVVDLEDLFGTTERADRVAERGPAVSVTPTVTKTPNPAIGTVEKQDLAHRIIIQQGLTAKVYEFREGRLLPVELPGQQSGPAAGSGSSDGGSGAPDGTNPLRPAAEAEPLKGVDLEDKADPSAEGSKKQEAGDKK
jgi:pilus assembly protein CpaB